MKNGQETEMRCVICQEPAVYSLSPDLDVRGLGACENHRTDVQRAYEILVYLGEDDYEEFIAARRKEFKG